MRTSKEEVAVKAVFTATGGGVNSFVVIVDGF